MRGHKMTKPPSGPGEVEIVGLSAELGFGATAAELGVSRLGDGPDVTGAGASRPASDCVSVLESGSVRLDCSSDES